ncbi:MAG: bifunctional phosphopantothenoylcysteine decarboxylase/phosphopantothenate--cysteine ligase CoaBC [Chloroflexi bacterium]|nr:bifunctional phosphopantothenoylcysteine decarboxylase/phosphopantothenate--cysteine ligase CoaBC [Chloroflexota bacterium]MCY3581881.1 bifunctional phosphopantothenoylcysteine decarboxylase/phosphopantothenate--cysteine ligase CoaBC [Chloroflexota bacterium]MCY3716842.1 bifunctional phosphopantothenoylcysteine decarboxylase/phosphopantothenate--cysteine ligase CoaBC [Chloroflexota bacterium]MDE2649672.1 bifunctional phosphopantothenoylcysteine decarboxylase/phosphopantothenate--cysteine liga
MSNLRGKRILLGVCGSIAAYKAVDLASKLTQADAEVDVIMTVAAQRFVSALTFQAATGRSVYSDLWTSGASGGLPSHIAHIGLAEAAGLFIIAPATANTLAKLAQGMADDMLTVSALAAACPLLLAPAMDGNMYEHPATQANLQTLQSRGAQLIPPESGRLASGLSGRGRLPETATLLGHCRRVLGLTGELAGKKVVVTAGGTREALDPVRYLSNRSSGKQGYAIAQAAIDAGARVVLISSAQHLPTPVGAQLVPVESAETMCRAALEHVLGAAALVMVAAVVDYRPRQVAQRKIKKTDSALRLELARTDDILLAVKAQRAASSYPNIVVGFAAESDNLLENARGKLRGKGLDLVVANDISAPDAGFAVDSNRVTVLDAHGGSQRIELSSKASIAASLIQRISSLLG